MARGECTSSVQSALISFSLFLCYAPLTSSNILFRWIPFSGLFSSCFNSTCSCSSYLFYIFVYLLQHTLLSIPSSAFGMYLHTGTRFNDIINHRSSLERRARGRLSGFKVQNKKCRRGPATTAAAAAAATLVPSGTVSVPLPRTPNENIRSNTNHQ